MAKDKKGFVLYSEKLKDPRWQRKRLEIMERDEFQCKCCLSKKNTLTVHHKWYIKNKDPWDYVDSCFITFCDKCHTLFHSEYEDVDIFNYFHKRGLNKTDLFILLWHIEELFKKLGYPGMKMLSQNLLSMIINEDEL